MWEYNVVTARDLTKTQLTEELDKLGANRWELVSATYFGVSEHWHFFFKRPLLKAEP